MFLHGSAATIGARAFDVLLALVERRDRMVSKNELLELVWPGVIVEENNLQVQISTLRKLLGARSVATIAGRGYRFALEAETDAPTEAAPTGMRRHNLPEQLNRFIGRASELVEARALLGTARLLTFTGVGGTGKTRLSLQLAAAVLDEFPDGVWFVELAALADESLVPQAVAAVLQVREQAGHSLVEALASHLRARRLLLVLDNCEALVQGCAAMLRELLQVAPGLTVLASSREHLRVAGETVYAVSALPTPTRDAPLDLAALAQSDAVHLFVDRAQAVQPAFKLSLQNASAVVEICRRVDGLPLAIELAAARVMALPVEKIAARLADRLRLLTGGDHSGLPHHQTLRASIDWSYDLLNEAERLLLCRLAVFAGGWSLEQAEFVCAVSLAERAAVGDVLASLVEKSLAMLDAEGARYRLLETVREYALERLAASGEKQVVQGRHLDFFTTLAEEARLQINGAAKGIWLARLDTERENLLAAHAYCETVDGGAEAGLRLICALKHYWFNRGQLGLAHRLAVEALARIDPRDRSLLHSRALFIAGQLCVFMARYAEAPQYLESSLVIARALNDQARIAAVLQPLGVAALARADLGAARGYLQEALMLAESLGDPRDLGAAMTALAQLHRAEGKLDDAEPLYRQAMQMARDLDDRESVAIGLLNLAMVAIARRDFAQAARMLLEVATIIAEIGSRPAAQSLLEVSAGLAVQLGAWPQAARWFGAAEAQAAQSGLHRDPADEAFLLPLMTQARASMGEVKFAASEAAGRALPRAQALAETAAWLPAHASASAGRGSAAGV